MAHHSVQKYFFRFLLAGTISISLIPLFCSCALQETAVNRKNMEQIRVGMTQDQVRQIMGEPLTNESYHRTGLWYYYTNTQWFDGVVTRDECTPFVFDERGILLGFGIEFLQKNFQMGNWIEMTRNHELSFDVGETL